MRFRRRVPPDVPLLALAFAGVALLLVLADVLEPPRVALAEASAREGERVAVEARVLAVVHGARGRFLSLADPTGRLDALMGPGEGPSPGDAVRAVGIVARGERGFVLSVDRLEVVERAASRALSPAELAREPHAYEGARVLVRGEVRDGALAGDGARVALAGEPPPAREGWWLAAGTWGYRARDASFVLRVDAWSPRP